MRTASGPLPPSIISTATRWPSATSLRPPRFSADACKKMSLPPRSRTMKPNPFNGHRFSSGLAHRRRVSPAWNRRTKRARHFQDELHMQDSRRGRRRAGGVNPREGAPGLRERLSRNPGLMACDKFAGPI